MMWAFRSNVLDIESMSSFATFVSKAKEGDVWKKFVGWNLMTTYDSNDMVEGGRWLTDRYDLAVTINSLIKECSEDIDIDEMNKMLPVNLSLETQISVEFTMPPEAKVPSDFKPWVWVNERNRRYPLNLGNIFHSILQITDPNCDGYFLARLFWSVTGLDGNKDINLASLKLRFAYEESMLSVPITNFSIEKSYQLFRILSQSHSGLQEPAAWMALGENGPNFDIYQSNRIAHYFWRFNRIGKPQLLDSYCRDAPTSNTILAHVANVLYEQANYFKKRQVWLNWRRFSMTNSKSSLRQIAFAALTEEINKALRANKPIDEVIELLSYVSPADGRIQPLLLNKLIAYSIGMPDTPLETGSNVIQAYAPLIKAFPSDNAVFFAEIVERYPLENGLFDEIALALVKYNVLTPVECFKLVTESVGFARMSFIAKMRQFLFKLLDLADDKAGLLAAITERFTNIDIGVDGDGKTKPLRINDLLDYHIKLELQVYTRTRINKLEAERQKKIRKADEKYLQDLEEHNRKINQAKNGVDEMVEKFANINIIDNNASNSKYSAIDIEQVKTQEQQSEEPKAPNPDEIQLDKEEISKVFTDFYLAFHTDLSIFDGRAISNDPAVSTKYQKPAETEVRAILPGAGEVITYFEKVLDEAKLHYGQRL